MAIPFFGPFVAWAPPVIVAILRPGRHAAAAILMGIGWLVVMNVLQPRLMQEAVGIHPIVVLGSVLIGSKIAGITGAIFGIPIAAVLSAFFFHFLVADPRAVAGRRPGPRAGVEEREGRPVRVPREPVPGHRPRRDRRTAADAGRRDAPSDDRRERAGRPRPAADRRRRRGAAATSRT